MKILVESKFVTDAVATASVGTGVYGWIASAVPVLQFIFLMISIGLGLYAYWRIFKENKK